MVLDTEEHGSYGRDTGIRKDEGGTMKDEVLLSIAASRPREFEGMPRACVPRVDAETPAPYIST
jgi:hypothetical protein